MCDCHKSRFQELSRSDKQIESAFLASSAAIDSLTRPARYTYEVHSLKWLAPLPPEITPFSVCLSSQPPTGAPPIHTLGGLGVRNATWSIAGRRWTALSFTANFRGNCRFLQHRLGFAPDKLSCH